MATCLEIKKAEAIEASEATSYAAVIEAGSPADGKTLKELSFKTETGMAALAIRASRGRGLGELAI